MKRITFIFAMLFSVIAFAVAENTQRIQVLQYVPDRDNGAVSPLIHKRPLPGVSIDISGADPVHCDRIGCATVHFKNLKVGDHVYIDKISKPGFQLFSIADAESWYVPDNNHEMRQILMISDADLQWLEEQWSPVVNSRSGSQNGYYSPGDRLIYTDMSTTTPLQQKVLPMVLKNDLNGALSTLLNENLLEKYSTNSNGDPKVLQTIDSDMEFMMMIGTLLNSTSSEYGFSLLNSLRQIKSDIPWLMIYYPDYCHALRKYEEFDSFADEQLKNGHLSAANRAYIYFWQAFNSINSPNIEKTLELQLKALNVYDSIAAVTKHPEAYAYNRAVLSNYIGSQYYLMHDRQEMDHYFSQARDLFSVMILREPVLEFAVYPYMAVQAENYMKAKFHLELVDDMINKANAYTRINSYKNDSYLASYLSTMRRFASIQLLRKNYESAYQLLKEVEERETDFFVRSPQLRAEHYAQYLGIMAQVCIHLQKWEEADKALVLSYDAYDVVDRINPGNYKKIYLDIHLMHAPVRIATGQYHWARADLKRAEALAEELFVGNEAQLDSTLAIVENLRQYIAPKKATKEEAQAWSNPDLLEFCFITDTHNYGKSADIRDATKNIEAFVKYCNETPEIQIAVHGGDFINAYDTNHDRAIWCLTRARFQFTGLQVPFYTVRGNHDCNGKQWKDNKPDNSQIVTDRQYFNLFNPYSPTNPLAAPEYVTYNSNEPTRNYYYCDFDIQRVRMIFLNSYHRDTMELYGVTGEQIRWLAEEALDFSKKDNADDWSFIIVNHSFPPRTFNPVNQFMTAYAEGKNEFSATDHGVTFHWSVAKQKRANFIGMICGHQHTDIYNREQGFNHINVTRGFATGNEVEASPICFSHFIVDTKNHTLTEKRIGSGHTRIYVYGEKNEQIAPHLPFSSADGLGNYTTGAGENGRIITVTNLNDDGEGSLRWAVSQKGARYITFQKGGEIQLTRTLEIENDSITILGQTAPKPIILKGAPVVIKASEVICRYLTLIPGQIECIALSDHHFGQRNMILDHLTIDSPIGSCMALHYVEDATVQRCRLNGSYQVDVPTLVAGGFKVTYYNNLIQNGKRAVKISERQGSNRWNHLVRNVISGWSEYSIYGGANQAETSITENYYVPSAQSSQLKVLQVSADGTSRYYLRGNTIKGVDNHRQRDLTIDRTGVPWQMPETIDTAFWNSIPPVARPNPSQYGFSSTCITIAAFHYKEILGNPTPEETYKFVTENAGNILPIRIKKNKDKDCNGIPDQFESLEAWLLALPTEK